MQQHYVDFYSPGSFVAEVTRKPVDNWDVDFAVKLAGEIVERYGARPYGFRFVTRSRKVNDLDAKETASSGLYYLGGQIKTLAQVKARGNPDDRILIANMECNGWDRVVINDNSWRWTQPLGKDDVVLNVTLPEVKP